MSGEEILPLTKGVLVKYSSCSFGVSRSQTTRWCPYLVFLLDGGLVGQRASISQIICMM